MSIITIPSILIAVIIPILAFFIIYKLDFYKTGEFKTILICGIAGIAAFLGASFANSTTISQGWLTRMDVIRYSAPIIEEILKGLLLWYLIRRPNFTYFVEGAVYGFAAGIGFAVAENIQYILNDQSAGLMVAISRVISTNLMHAVATSILGIALGQARFASTRLRQISVGMLGLLIAMVLHVAYNNLVTRFTDNWVLLLVIATLIGLAGSAGIAYSIRLGLKTGKNWIEENLGMQDRVTSGEAAVVTRMEGIDNLLKPLAERFGEKKAADIKDFLLKQARLGLLRKSAQLLSEERMKRATEEEIAKLREEVDVARRKVGSYAMLFLRHTIPEDSSPLWGRLEALIQERTAARPATGGMNLWANLKSRQEEQQKQPKQETEE